MRYAMTRLRRSVLCFVVGTMWALEVLAQSAPVANSGPDQRASLGQEVRLDGSLSFDPDFDRLTYQWSFRTRPDCSRAVLVNTTSDTSEFVADCPGSYLVQLTVDDGIATGQAFVLVQTLNSPPAAQAGVDQTVAVGATTRLDGSGSSDRDGNPLKYVWTILPRPAGSVAALNDPASPFPTFAPDRAGQYRVRLVVNDGTVSSPADFVVISTLKSAPVAHAGTDQRVVQGAFVRLDGSRSYDVDDRTTLRYTWTFVARPPTSAAA